MSSDESPNVPAPRERREAVREKAQQVQAQQSRARLARRIAMGIGVVAIVAAAATVVTWAFASTAAKPQLSPANISNDGFTVTSVAGVAIDSSDSSAINDSATPSAAPSETPTPDPSATTQPAVDIRVYVDYLSSGSREFQLANVQQLSKWVTQDAATLTYYPVSMLTAKSNGTKYSLRAASAAACVATHAPDSFFAFNDALLRKQPSVDSDGLSDDELATLAIAAGAPDPKVVRSCIETESFSSWAKGATDRALQGLPDTDEVALTATPTVLVNGMPYVGALDDPKEFAQFVLTIASDAYYKTATPTPTASPSTTPSPTATP